MAKLFFFINFLAVVVFGQQYQLDSLENLLSSNKLSIERRIDILNEIAYKSYRINLNETFNFAKQAIQLSNESGYRYGLAEANRCVGIKHLFTGNQDSALIYFRNSKEIYKEFDDALGLSKVIGNIGTCYAFQGDFKTALDYYFEALNITSKLGLDQREAILLNNIGEIHFKIHNYNDALIYFERQLPIFNQFQDTTHILTTYTNLADTYRLLGNSEKATSYCDLGIKIGEAGKFNPYLCALYTIKGQLAVVHGEKYDALEFFKTAIDYSDTSTDVEYKWKPFFALAELYKSNNQLNMAKDYYLQAMMVSRLDGIPEGVKEATDGLYKVASRLNDYEEAFKYLLINKQISDSLLSESNIKRITTLEMQHDYDREQREAELEQKSQETIRNYLIVGFILVVILSIIIINQNRVKTKVNKKLKTANATKDKFITIIAHDLRNPIHSMLSSSDHLISEYNNLNEDDKYTLIQALNNSVKKLNTLLNNLLLWANTQRGSIEINKQHLSLFKLIEESIAPYEITAENKSIKIMNNVKKNAKCYCDKNTISTVIGNLINNAIKFTNENGEIKITSTKYNSSVEVCITDNGIGMDKETVDKLFKLDNHSSRSGTKNEIGSGLGLFICKEFVDLNGGIIKAVSKSNKGSKFSITIPVAHSHN